MTDQFLIKTFLARLPFILLISVGFSTYSFAQSAGTLDNTFGTNGSIITPLDTVSDKGNAIVIQDDGKIIMGGSTQNSFTSSDFALIRYNDDGTLDNSFGVGGTVITTIENRSEGQSVAIQSDGKILLGGYSKWYINLARYNTDGSLDTTFGLGGIVITDVPGYYSDKCKSVVVQSDGKILLGGYGQHFSSDQPYFTMVRYNANGSLDSTFGTNGIVIGGLGQGNSMRVLSDGKILLAGAYHVSGDVRFNIERYNSNGTVDTTFGVDGKVTTLIALSSKSYSMDIQNDGKIVLGGYSSSSIGNDFALARYNSNGSLDDTFGIDGIISTPVGDGTYSVGNSVVIQSDGKIVLAGKSRDGSNATNFALVRFNSDGTLDTNFGIDGKTVTPIGVSYSVGKSLGIDSNGKILLGGYAYNGSSVETVLVRYNGNASVGIGSVNQIDNKVYPNPFTSSTTIQFGLPIYNAELVIYNAFGQLVKHIENISGEEIQLSRNNLTSGVYFFKLIENNKIIAADKLIINDE